LQSATHLFVEGFNIGLAGGQILAKSALNSFFFIFSITSITSGEGCVAFFK